jgi:hypothetical protein
MAGHQHAIPGHVWVTMGIATARVHLDSSARLPQVEIAALRAPAGSIAVMALAAAEAVLQRVALRLPPGYAGDIAMQRHPAETIVA